MAIGATAITANARDPVGDARDRVSDARTAADDASIRYFAALEEFETLGAQIEETEGRIEALDARTEVLRAELRERAVVAYRSAGASPLDFTTGGLDAARRTAMLAELNERGELVAQELETGIDELEGQQRELEAARSEREGALAAFRQEQAELDAVLADAQSEYADRVAAREAREAAAAAAAAEAPAAEAPPATEPVAPPADTGGTDDPPAPDSSPTGGVHPHHDDPFLVCTRARESGGNYQAYNPAGPYLGAYQFLQSTWNSTANNAGRPGLIGVDPRNASQYDQDDMAWSLYQSQGKGPWGGYC